jgi:hypothetical protein
LANKIMPNDSNAPAHPMPGRLGEGDYRSLCAAIESSARGRDFLAEFARRNRHADTEMLVGALDRLETLMRAEGTALERLRDELRMLLIAIRLARPDIDAASPQTKAAKLASLLDLLERRIDAMADSKPGDAAHAAEDTAPAPAPLTIVPRPDEPELPIPQPAAATPPAIALVQAAQTQAQAEATEVQQPEPPWQPVFKMDAAAANNAPEKWLPDFGDDPALIIHTKPTRTAAFMPEISLFGGAQPDPVVVEVPSAAPPEPAAVAAPVDTAIPAMVAAPKPAALPPPPDPLAAIMALSEEERIALFT